MKKTKELIIDFRKEVTVYMPVNIKGTEVDKVPQYDYLGTTVTENLAKKAMKGMYHLRKLSVFCVSRKLR